MITPLLESGLVRKHVDASGESNFELIHDFAVRSVVRAWRELDRERSGMLAARKQVQQAERRRSTISLQILAVTPLLTIVAIVIAGMYENQSSSSSLWTFLAVAGVAVSATFSAVHGVVYPALAVAGLGAVSLIAPENSLVLVLPLTAVTWAIPAYLFGLFESKALPWGLDRLWVLRLVAAEYIDVCFTLLIGLFPLLVAATLSLRAWGVLRDINVNSLVLCLSLSASILLQLLYSGGSGFTLGGSAMDLEIRSRDGRAASRGERLRRLLVLMIWALVDLGFFLPTLILSPITASAEGGVYDVMVGTRMVSRTPSSPPQRRAAVSYLISSAVIIIFVIVAMVL
jgi:hypothetical protein